MTQIDVDNLRAHLIDVCGAAMFNGLPAALPEIDDIERMSGEELCHEAEALGIDLQQFVVEE